MLQKWPRVCLGLFKLDIAQMTLKVEAWFRVAWVLIHCGLSGKVTNLVNYVQFINDKIVETVNILLGCGGFPPYNVSPLLRHRQVCVTSSNYFTSPFGVDSKV